MTSQEVCHQPDYRPIVLAVSIVSSGGTGAGRSVQLREVLKGSWRGLIDSLLQQPWEKVITLMTEQMLLNTLKANRCHSAQRKLNKCWAKICYKLCCQCFFSNPSSLYFPAVGLTSVSNPPLFLLISFFFFLFYVFEFAF